MIMSFFLFFRSILMQAAFQGPQLISEEGLADHFLTNFQNIITLKEHLTQKHSPDDPNIVIFEDKGGDIFLIRVGHNYLYHEADALQLKGQDLEPEDKGFYFNIMPSSTYGYQIVNRDKCLEIGEYNGPLDGYEIIMKNCSGSPTQTFDIQPAPVSEDQSVPEAGIAQFNN